MVITWNENQHGLGIPDLDTQHQQLFALTNQLLEAGASPASPDRQRKIVAIVKQVYAYTRYHFSTEESVFAHYGYPQAGDHRKAHLAFTNRIQSDLAASREPAYDPGPLSDDLVDWILNHISREDRTFAAYFRSQGISVEAHFAQGPGTAGEPTPRTNANSLWQEKKLALDIASIDHQHQELVLILQQANDLQKAAPERRRTFLPAIIEKLGHYAEYHFLFEEELMSRHGFPAIADHQRLHQGYIQRIAAFSRELARDNHDLNDEIVGFLKQWIVDHILVEDKAFKTQCREALSHDH